MIKLNLLPEKVRAAERLRLILVLGSLVYVVALLLLGWRWSVAKAGVAEAAREVDAVYAELNAPGLKEAVDAVERFTRDQADKDAKASVVNALRKRQATLLRFIDALGDWTLDNQVWFTGVRVEEDSAKAARAVTIDGFAINPLAFASFFGLLESQPLVVGLKLEHARNGTDLQQNVYSFKVAFSLEDYQ
jgi:Tfp pilus assembly protein PilN